MIRAVVLDLDGCVYIGSKPIPGAVKAIEHLRETGYKVIFLTNNSTVSREMICKKLTSMNITCSVDDVMSSSAAASIYLRRERGPTRVYAVGEGGLLEELRLAGHELVEEYIKAEAVVVGLDREVTYAKLREAHKAITRGAFFLATNKDNVLPIEEGTIPGAGSLVAFLEVSTGKKALSVGKPERFIVELALAQAGVPVNEAIVVGDRIDTDIGAAKNLGIPAVLVMTGTVKEKVPQDLDVIRDISELPSFLERFNKR